METPLRYYKGRGRYSVVFVVDFKCVSENVSRLVDFYAVLIFGTYYLVTSHVSVYIYILYIWFRSWTSPTPPPFFIILQFNHIYCVGGKVRFPLLLFGSSVFSDSHPSLPGIICTFVIHHGSLQKIDCFIWHCLKYTET